MPRDENDCDNLLSKIINTKKPDHNRMERQEIIVIPCIEKEEVNMIDIIGSI